MYLHRVAEDHPNKFSVGRPSPSANARQPLTLCHLLTKDVSSNPTSRLKWTQVETLRLPSPAELTRKKRRRNFKERLPPSKLFNRQTWIQIRPQKQSRHPIQYRQVHLFRYWSDMYCRKCLGGKKKNQSWDGKKWESRHTGKGVRIFLHGKLTAFILLLSLNSLLIRMEVQVQQKCGFQRYLLDRCSFLLVFCKFVQELQHYCR